MAKCRFSSPGVKFSVEFRSRLCRVCWKSPSGVCSTLLTSCRRSDIWRTTRSYCRRNRVGQAVSGQTTRLQRVLPCGSSIAGRHQHPHVRPDDPLLCSHEPRPRRRQGTPLPNRSLVRTQALPPVRAHPAQSSHSCIRHNLALSVRRPAVWDSAPRSLLACTSYAILSCA